MFKHNLLLAFRNFKRFKGTFFINLIGLSTGLACAILIFLWVGDEFRVDKFHSSDARLYQVMANHHQPERIVTIESTPGLLAEALVNEVPGIEFAASTSTSNETFLVSQTETHVKAKGKFASRDFFNVFSYTLSRGKKDQVLTDPNAIVVSETLAKNLFGQSSDVVGKTVEWSIQNFKHVVTITGVFQDAPEYSSDQFDFVLSFEYFQDNVVTYPTWGNNYASTILVLKKDTDVQEFGEKIVGFIKKHQADSNIKLFLQHYSDRYLYGSYENGTVSGGRITYVTLFSIIAIFILVIACINFMNLSTAKASRRIKEVGIKKAVGAFRHTLVKQYLGESMLMAFVSLFMALILVQLLLSSFNNITGKNLGLSFDRNGVLLLLGVTIFTGIVSGSYPALYLSGFNPATVLKGKLHSSIGEIFIRKGLVIFQFALSVILIVSVLVVYKQIEFVQNKNLGYDKDNVIYFEQEGKVMTSKDVVLNELKKIPGVVNAALSDYKIGEESWTYGVTWEGNEDYNLQFMEMSVGYDALEMLGIDIEGGRSFSRQFSSDSSGIIFNEAAINAMGLVDAVGKKVKHYTGEKTIIGVVKDFHYKSLYNAVGPMLIHFNPDETRYVTVKIQAGQEQETIANIQNFYKTFNPGYTLDYKFMDEDYEELYAAEMRVGTLSKYFAGLAIIISCLGLLGLAAFTAERRIKEIGVRKILGSTEYEIVLLLSRDFTSMIFMAIAIALPISYLLAKSWLGNFQFKIELETWYFAVAGILALCIGWITVASQTIKAAKVNPAQSLRSE
jgi:ABC-type antimicrobial peptide transport system permease subunit